MNSTEANIWSTISTPVTAVLLTPLVAAIIGSIFERLSANSKNREQEFYFKRIELIEKLRTTVNQISDVNDKQESSMVLDLETQGVIRYLKKTSVFDRYGDYYGQDLRPWYTRFFTIRHYNSHFLTVFPLWYFYTILFMAVLYGPVKLLFPDFILFRYLGGNWISAIIYLAIALVIRLFLWFTDERRKYMPTLKALKKLNEKLKAEATSLDT